jgi:fructose-1,6-bisphosphatase/inositol monophosphatase family enzyme
MPQYDPHAICHAALPAIRTVIKEINSKVENSPDRFLDKEFSTRRKKMALLVDLLAESRFGELLAANLRDEAFDIQVFGEETIDQESNFTDLPGVFALADMVDGTDLLERGLSNWCSAVVFFVPMNAKGSRIVAACVGLPSGDVYYSREGMDDVMVYLNPESHPDLRREDKYRPVKGAISVTETACASICFYGQKSGNLEAVAQTQLFPALAATEAAKTDAAEDKAKICRLYNLGGIPMMINLIDPRSRVGANIDAVFDIHGQHAHDVCAGAYLALKAGAIMKDLSGKLITNLELENALLEPSSTKFKYVLAGAEQLCDSVLRLVTTPRQIPNN